MENAAGGRSEDGGMAVREGRWGGAGGGAMGQGAGVGRGVGEGARGAWWGDESGEVVGGATM